MTFGKQSLVALSLIAFASACEIQTNTRNDSSPSASEDAKDKNEIKPINDELAYSEVFLIDAFETDSPIYQKAFGLADDVVANGGIDATKLLDQSAALLFEIADEDKSGDLSLEEFVSFRVLAMDQSTDAAVRIKSWREKNFEDYDANKDGKLSKEEGKKLLDGVSEYVAKLRKERGGDIQEYVKVYYQGILVSYDKDKDGKLSSEERTTLRADAKEQALAFKKQLVVSCAVRNDKNKDICNMFDLIKNFCKKDNANPIISQLCVQVVNDDTSTSTSSATATATSTSTNTSADTQN